MLNVIIENDILLIISIYLVLKFSSLKNLNKLMEMLLIMLCYMYVHA